MDKVEEEEKIENKDEELWSNEEEVDEEKGVAKEEWRERRKINWLNSRLDAGETKDKSHGSNHVNPSSMSDYTLLSLVSFCKRPELQEEGGKFTWVVLSFKLTLLTKKTNKHFF